MKKIILLFLFIFCIVNASSSLAVTAPTRSVWFEPGTATTGDAITLNAFVYNNGSVEASETVEFKTATGEKINTQLVTVVGEGARTVSVPWKMPAVPTTVVASVIQAVDVKKVEIKGLLGEIGQVTVQSTNVVTTVAANNWQDKTKTWFKNFFAKVEIFRLNKAAYFATMRDGAKVRLDIIVPKDTTTNTTPTVGNPGAIGADITSDLPASKALGKPGDYFIVIFATALASFFASAILFYVGIGLIIFFLIRFLFGRFS